MLVALLTKNELTATPPIVTAVAPVKFVPEMFMVLPSQPYVGVKTEIVGGGKKVKPDKLAVPPASVMLTLPLAPLPTTAVIVVALTTEKEPTAAPPKLTAVVPVKFDPVMVIVFPADAVTGVKEVMVAAGVTVSVMLLLIAVAVVWQILLAVKTQLILSLLFSVASV